MDDFDKALEESASTTLIASPNRLAREMLQWFDLQEAADSIKARIERAATHLGKTVDVGTIRCSFFKPKKQYGSWEDIVTQQAEAIKADDDEAAADYIAAIIEDNTHTTTTVKTDWAAVCKDIGLERDELDPAPARATLKVMK